MKKYKIIPQFEYHRIWNSGIEKYEKLKIIFSKNKNNHVQEIFKYLEIEDSLHLLPGSKKISNLVTYLSRNENFQRTNKRGVYRMKKGSK